MATSSAGTMARRAKRTDANRRAKRDQIIDAAKEVLAREGVAACTARAVADASPLTKSAIHYYFNDVNEIVDDAMLAHVDAMLDALRRKAKQPAGPRERLHRVVGAYLATFADQPHAAFLWFEYWIAAGRRGSLDGAGDMLKKVRVLLLNLVSDLPVDDPEQATHTLLSWLLGTIVQQHVRPRTTEALRQEVDRIIGGNH